jgi:hypothetical protein
MKRTVIAAFLALSAASVLAANSQYTNEAGEQDQHQPQLGDAGNTSGNQEQSSPQVG